MTFEKLLKILPLFANKMGHLSQQTKKNLNYHCHCSPRRKTYFRLSFDSAETITSTLRKI